MVNQSVDVRKNSHALQLMPPQIEVKRVEHTKGVTRIRKSNKESRHNGQQKKENQRSIKHIHFLYIYMKLNIE